MPTNRDLDTEMIHAFDAQQMSQYYGFSDVLDDGRIVTSLWNQVTPAQVCWGSQVVDYPILGRDWLIYLRAVLGPESKAYAIGKAVNDPQGLAWVVCSDGRTLSIGPTAGVSCVGILYARGMLTAAIGTSGTNVEFYDIHPDAWVAMHVSRQSIPPTSQGFLDLVDGPLVTVLPTDPIERTLVGRQVGFPCTRGSLIVAQDGPTTNCVVTGGQTWGTLQVADGCFEPHLSQNAKYWVMRGTMRVYGGLMPRVIPPLVEPTPIPVPPTPTPVPPVPVPTPIPVPPVPTPIPPQEPPMPSSDFPQVGDRGAYRPMNTTDPTQRATLIPNQDSGFMSLSTVTGVQHFNPTTGNEDGYRSEPVGTGEERIKFVTPNVFVSRSGDPDSGPMMPFEWYGR